jgi:mRNA interferase RelE/StbE
MKAEYKIVIKKSAVKEIKTLPDIYLKKVLNKISLLAKEPRPAVCKKLSQQNKYRIGVSVYKIFYLIEDYKLIVTIVKIAHRKNAC